MATMTMLVLSSILFPSPKASPSSRGTSQPPPLALEPRDRQCARQARDHLPLSASDPAAPLHPERVKDRREPVAVEGQQDPPCLHQAARRRSPSVVFAGVPPRAHTSKCLVSRSTSRLTHARDPRRCPSRPRVRCTPQTRRCGPLCSARRLQNPSPRKRGLACRGVHGRW